MNRVVKLLFALFALIQVGAASRAMAQQTSIIPITDTTNSNGAFVRGASNDGKRIVFESSNDYTGENIDGNNEIFVYDTDLRKIIQLTKTGSQSTTGSSGGQTLSGRNCPGGCPPGQSSTVNAVPAISGDGTRIVFASTSGPAHRCFQRRRQRGNLSGDAAARRNRRHHPAHHRNRRHQRQLR